MKSGILSALFFSLCIARTVSAQNPAGIEVQFSETYELANVILALTPYGIFDESEVQKGTPYYKEVMAYFQPVKEHPLLEKVNYSREKWEDYLSFRTDAFAFEVNSAGKIVRRFDFKTNTGHQPFDDHLALVQDFYEKSGFHAFYQQHQAYFQGIESRYKDYFMVEKMQQFLTEEFGAFQSNTNNLIVCSPLVYRMNCRRPIDKSTSADFATLAMALLLPEKAGETDQEQRASDIHFLFTEMDHGYVNPITNKNARLVRKNFKPKNWDNGSGYGGNNCFNEYMTWAVYDLFILKYFPQYADQLSRNWHIQNNSRGFIASGLFGRKLQELYAGRKDNERIKDLYPRLLEWSGSIQNVLKVPVLVADSVQLAPGKNGEPFDLVFSETIHKIPELDCVLFKIVNGERSTIKILNLEAEKTVWFQNKTLRVQLQDLPAEPGLYGLTFNNYGRKHELTAENGASVPCPTRFFIRIR